MTRSSTRHVRSPSEVWLVFRRVLIAGAVVAFAGLALVTTATGVQTKSYVAVGDSYTAGPIIAMQQQDPVACFRSDHNYPHLVAAALQVPVFRDASCSGAGTEDMTESQDVNPGPANPPQFDSLDKSTRLVTVGIGGNDIGFEEIIRACATADRSSTPCQDRYLRGSNDEIKDRIAKTGPKIGEVLKGIRKRSPKARVFVVNYLSILPETGSGCWPQVPFADADVPYLRAKQHELNDELARQAKAKKAKVVDAFKASLGHDACQPSGVRWVEPIIGSSGAAPLHPNQLGMECTAVAVLAVTSPRTPTEGLCKPPAVVESRTSAARKRHSSGHPQF
jgi:lysophospholipase L1-like esterase